MRYSHLNNDSDINDRLVMNFLDVKHTMRHQYEGRGSQTNILVMLLEVKEITQRELTWRLGIQPGSASEVLGKLTHAGLIERTTSEKDRRTALITLTEKGKQLAEEALKQRTERHHEMFACLTEEEKNTLLSLLEKINEDWGQKY
jgi:DNA-binding MarR family transcriptional regulator